MKPLNQTWSIAQSVEMACILEASAPKLGNVHPAAGFRDMHYGHFLTSALAISPLFDSISADSALPVSVGHLVLEAASATRQQVECNTNLGTLLLLAPLALAAARSSSNGFSLTASCLEESTGQVLQSLTSEDCRHVYAAIRMAQPGGLGKQEQGDVYSEAPENLISAMRQVSDIDAVARQYVTGFHDVFHRLWPWLREEMNRSNDPMHAIVGLQIRWLAWEPDGLIVRKMGIEEARRIQREANVLRDLLLNHSEDFEREFRRFDQYLRADGNRRNPGTTADLIAATLFCQLVCCNFD